MDGLAPDLRPFIGVGVLLLLFLAMASLVQKYQAWQAEKAARAQRLIRGARRLARGLDTLGPGYLPPDLLQVLEDELRTRYQAVLTLFPQDARVAAWLEELGQGSTPERLDAEWTPPEVKDDADLTRFSQGLTLLVVWLREESGEALLPEDARQLRERLIALRAQVHYAYRIAQAHDRAAEGDWDGALAAVNLLLLFLRERAPRGDQGKALYAQAMEVYQRLMHKQPLDDEGKGA